MPIKLYQHPGSGPCRSVMMTARHLGIEMEHIYLDLYKSKHLTPEFLKLNPQHCVPTIDDDGFVIWESRAILRYLVNRHAPDSPLYPKDPKAKAIVDQILDFDIGNLYVSLIGLVLPKRFQNREPSPAEELKAKNALAIFEKILEDSTYAAGENITIADYSILAGIDYMDQIMDYKYDDYPKISAWYERMKKETPDYRKINEIPLKEYRKFLDSSEFEEFIKSGGLQELMNPKK